MDKKNLQNRQFKEDQSLQFLGFKSVCVRFMFILLFKVFKMFVKILKIYGNLWCYCERIDFYLYFDGG